jgi:hypothetical protein
MQRTTSVLFLGLFGLSAALQGAAACSNSTAAPTGNDSGPPAGNEDAGSDDSGQSNSGQCFGDLPVMTVTGPDGGQIAPDWSCYEAGANALFVPRLVPMTDDAGDAEAEDAGDAAFDAADASEPADSSVDSSAPDSSAPDAATADSGSGSDASAGDGGDTYELQLTDFVTTQPPVNATVDIYWGGSPAADGTYAYRRQANATGAVFFPPPPPNTPLMSYHVSNALADAGQASLFWISAVIVPPPGATKFNSLATSSLSDLVTAVLGSETPNPADSVVVTGACDCQYRDVTGGQFQMYDPNGSPVNGGTNTGDPRVVYLQNNQPNTSCTFTTTTQGGRAVWSMINAPPSNPTSGKPYTIKFMGRMSASQTTPQVLATYPVETYAGGVSVMRAFKLNATPPN